MAIIFFTSSTLFDIIDPKKYTKQDAFMLVVMVEHIIIGFKYLLAILIKDKPVWVTNAEHEIADSMEAIYDMIDQKEDDFKATGGQLL